jgi:hypothetical protein
MTLLNNSITSIDAAPRGADAPIVDEGHQPTPRELIATLRAAHLPEIPSAESADHVAILAECEARWLHELDHLAVSLDRAILELPPEVRQLVTNADAITVQKITLDQVAPIPNVYGLPSDWTFGSFDELGQLVNELDLPDNVDPRLSNMLDMVGDVWLDDDRRVMAHACLNYFPAILVPVHDYFAATGQPDQGLANRYAAKGIKWIAVDGNARLAVAAAASKLTVPAAGETTVPEVEIEEIPVFTAVSSMMRAAAARIYETDFIRARAVGERNDHVVNLLASNAIDNASSWSADGWTPLAGLKLDDDMLVWAARYATPDSVGVLVAWEESDPGFLSDSVWSSLTKRDGIPNATTLSPTVEARIRAAQTRRGPVA